MTQKIPVIRRKHRRMRGNKKLLFLLALFFLIVLVLIFFQSPLSKVTSIAVSGNHFVPEEQIVQISELNEGDGYFRVQGEEVSQRITELEFVESVQVDKQFPGKIHIEVKEYPHVAFEYAGGATYAVLANAQTIELDPFAVPDKPILSRWDNQEALKLRLCTVLGAIPDQHVEDVSEIIPYPSASYEDRILFYTRSGFEVVTTVSKLSEKLSYLDEIILELAGEEIYNGRLVLLEADTHVPLDNSSETETAESEVEEAAEGE